MKRILQWFLAAATICLLYYAGCVEQSACDFSIPIGYNLVKFGNGEYGIKYGNELLKSHNARYGRGWTDMDNNNYYEIQYAMFTDSCRAKGNLKNYLENINSNKIVAP